MSSSYSHKTLSYDDIFKTVTWLTKPKTILEFGILNGFSLKCFATIAPDAKIVAYDIFEKFNGNSAKRDIVDLFKEYKNVDIREGDFYKVFESLANNSIDILHIDIANDGLVYEFAFDKYLEKLTDRGIILLEGGSLERDNVEWMLKYKKSSIHAMLKKYESVLDIHNIDGFPSMTIVRKRG